MYSPTNPHGHNGGSAGKPYRIAIRVIKEKRIAAAADAAPSSPSSSPSSAAAGGVSMGSERLLSFLPSNFCNVWHPKATDSRFQLGEMVGAAMAQGCGVYTIDCGYEEESLGLNDDMLAHYVRNSSYVPQQGIRSLAALGGGGGGGFTLGGSEGPSSSNNGAGGPSTSTSTSREGIAVAFIEKLLNERSGHTVQFSFFAMSGIDRPVTDLLLPLMPVATSATIAGTMDEKQTGTLSSLLITSVKQFNEVIASVTSSNSFRLARPRLSFGLIFKSHNVPHVMLLLNAQHQRLAIATIEGQLEELPATVQQRLRELDAANNRMGMSSVVANRAGMGGLASVFGGSASTAIDGSSSVGGEGQLQSQVADFYGSGSNLQHDPHDAANPNNNTNASLRPTHDPNAMSILVDGGDGETSLAGALGNIGGGRGSGSGGIDYSMLKQNQQKRLLCAAVLAHIRRTMALHFIKEQRLEYFKPMYVVRIGGDQKGRDPLGMLPFILARGSPNTMINRATGADYRILMNGMFIGPNGATVGEGATSPWNGGVGGANSAGNGGIGGIDQHQYAMLMAGLNQQQQHALQQQILQQQQRQYQQELLKHQQQLQAAAAGAGLSGSVLMFRPPMAPPTADNLFNNLPSRGGMMGGTKAMAASSAHLHDDATNPLMLLVPENALPTVSYSGAMGMGGGVPVAGGQRFQQYAQLQPTNTMGGPAMMNGLNNSALNTTSASAMGGGAVPTLSHMSRMVQSPTQVPYALLQNPANHGGGSKGGGAAEPSSPSASASTSRRPPSAASGRKGAGTNNNTASDSLDDIIARFETIDQEDGESEQAAAYRSELGLTEGYTKPPGKGDDPQALTRGRNATTDASVVAPPAVKPFMVTDNTIPDTFLYLEKEKHVCRNAHRELQKDIHDVLRRTEEVMQRHERVREAMQRKRLEMQRLEKDVEGSHHRTTQVRKIVEVLEKEIKGFEEAMAMEDVLKRKYVEEDAAKEKERAEKRRLHHERLSNLQEEHRSRKFQQGTAAAKEQEDLSIGIAAAKRAAEAAMAALRRELITVSGELTMATEKVNDLTGTIQTQHEKIAEQTQRRRNLEVTLERLRVASREEQTTNAQIEHQRLEVEGLKERIRLAERGLAAYDHFMAEDAKRIAEEVAATIERTAAPKQQQQQASTEGKDADGDATDTKATATDSGKPPLANGGVGMREPSNQSTANLFFNTDGSARGRSSSILGGNGASYRLSSPTMSQLGTPFNVSLAIPEGGGGGTANSTSIFTPDTALFTPEEAAHVSSRIESLSALRRSTALLRAQVQKQSRLLALKRARMVKYRALATIEDAEAGSRAAIVSEWRSFLSTEVAPLVPDSYQKSHRTYEMITADGVGNAFATAAARLDSSSSTAANALQHQRHAFGGVVASVGQGGMQYSPTAQAAGGSAMKRSSSVSSTGSSSSPNTARRRIRFVDIDTDLASATQRLNIIRQEVQAKVRERLALVAQLEVLRSDVYALANDAEAVNMQEELQKEIEGVGRLRAAQKEVFHRQEEELNRRRRVFMSMFVDFYPQIKKEVGAYEVQQKAVLNAGTSRSRPTPRASQLTLMTRRTPTSTIVADAAAHSAARSRQHAAAEGGGGANGGGVPRYLQDTVASQSRRRTSASTKRVGGHDTSSATNDDGYPDDAASDTSSVFEAIVVGAETVYTTEHEGGRGSRRGGTEKGRGGAGADGGATNRFGCLSSEAHVSERGDGGVYFDAEADLDRDLHEASQNNPSAGTTSRALFNAKDNAARFAAMAVKHINGQHTRNGTNPVGLTGQANITVDQGDAVCNLYWKWRGVLDEGKQLQLQVTEKQESVGRLEDMVSDMGERIAALRSRLGKLTAQREMAEAERARQLQTLSNASSTMSAATLADDAHAATVRKRHQHRMFELHTQQEAINKLCQGIEEEVAMGRDDVRRIKHEVESIVNETNSLPDLVAQRELLKTENALLESYVMGIRAAEDEATERAIRRGGGGGSVLGGVMKDVSSVGMMSSVAAMSSTAGAAADEADVRSREGNLSPLRRRQYAAAFAGVGVATGRDAATVPSPAALAAVMEAEAASSKATSGGGTKQGLSATSQALLASRLHHHADGTATAKNNAAGDALNISSTTLASTNKPPPTTSGMRLPQTIMSRIQKHKERQQELNSSIASSMDSYHRGGAAPAAARDLGGGGRGDESTVVSRTTSFGTVSRRGDGGGGVGGYHQYDTEDEGGMATPPPLSSAGGSASSAYGGNNHHHHHSNKQQQPHQLPVTLVNILHQLERREDKADRRLAAADAFMSRNAAVLARPTLSSRGDDGGADEGGEDGESTHHDGITPIRPKADDRATVSAAVETPVNSLALVAATTATANNTSSASKYAELRDILAQHIAGMEADD